MRTLRVAKRLPSGLPKDPDTLVLTDEAVARRRHRAKQRFALKRVPPVTDPWGRK